MAVKIANNYLPVEEYIDMLSKKSNLINFNNNNSKTGIACLNLSMPAGITCREDAPCYDKDLCYACKGRQNMCNVKAAYYRNLRLYKENPDDFFEQVEYTLKHSGLTMVRLFDCGDIPDIDFLVRIVNTCNHYPEVKFMAFTKKYEIVNEYLNENALPDNLNIVFSAWDKKWTFENPHNLPIAYVRFKDNSINPDIPENAFKCPGRKSTCSACKVCWNKKLKSVVFEQH